jgi:hypothetical protein
VLAHKGVSILEVGISRDTISVSQKLSEFI